MKNTRREIQDRSFTFFSSLSIVLMVGALVIILGPMLRRGFSAVFFQGTVEFRRMQLAQFGHGDEEAVADEVAQVTELRQEIYAILNKFQAGIEPSALIDRVRSINREYGQELRGKNIVGADYTELRRRARDLRDLLQDALESTDRELVEANLKSVLQHRADPLYTDSVMAEMFVTARQYQNVIQGIDLSHREQYLEPLLEVKDQLRKLLGPMPGEQAPLLMEEYGATRWDIALETLHDLLWQEQWVTVEAGQELQKQLVRREESQFAGTSLAPMFGLAEDHLTDLLRPKRTIYWHYFTDDWKEGHFFGGVGPEIYGTLLITLLTMLFAIPFGVISAAFLVECASEHISVKIIRICVNTLAGVPSIVFGLFGMAFFVLFILPNLDRKPQGCILTAAMTLAVLVLPVIIRASEEAIRSVPATYREASLALGAGKFRTFMTVTLPAALPGILTGIILSLSRAAGETAPILFTGAVDMGPVPRSLFEGSRTLATSGYYIAVGDKIGMMAPHKQYGLITTLIVLVLGLNILAILLRSRMSRKLRGQ